MEYKPDGQRPQQLLRSLFSKASSEIVHQQNLPLSSDFHSPKAIRESVPRVNDAFLPTAKVDSIAKEFPRPGSSAEGVGSTKGFSAVGEEVVISLLWARHLEHRRTVGREKQGG